MNKSTRYFISRNDRAKNKEPIKPKYQDGSAKSHYRGIKKPNEK